LVCPGCGGELTKRVRYGESLDMCAVCGGIWLENGALGAIIRNMEAVLSLPRNEQEKSLSRSMEKDCCRDQRVCLGYGERRKAFFDFFD
jgi:Zn-finger nucleic acid-binding protein